MKKEFEDYITFHTEAALGKVNKHLINSALVSAQNRKRFYWTNIEGIEQPKDKGLLLRDVLDYSCEDTLSEGEMAFMLRSESTTKDLPRLKARAKYENQKSNTLTASSAKGVPHRVIGWVDRDKSYCLDASYYKGGNPKSYFEKSRRQLIFNRPCELKDFDPKSNCHHVANATDIKGNESIKRIYADTGKSPTLTTMGGGHREPKVLIVPEQVKVRKHEVDIFKLQSLLKEHRRPVKEISEALYVKKTTVEHWFRTDSSFSIPDADSWFDLKDFLNIKTNKFDACITEFEIRDGKYEMADRVYSPDGKSPTVVASNVAKVSVKGGAIRNQVTKRGIETQLNIRKDDKSNCVVASWSHKLNGVVEYFDDQPTYRKLSVEECESLQTFPQGYTEGVSNTQRYRSLGNSFTVDVVAEIFKYL
tara:strand:+ start:5 stop:1261 length:1257 start_codon:yes stop_codon:yes gene_type:complete